jgi:hypothetical protein
MTITSRVLLCASYDLTIRFFRSLAFRRVIDERRGVAGNCRVLKLVGRVDQRCDDHA